VVALAALVVIRLTTPFDDEISRSVKLVRLVGIIRASPRAWRSRQPSISPDLEAGGGLHARALAIVRYLRETSVDRGKLGVATGEGFYGYSAAT
jgi:hypothetical protein